MKNKFSLTIVSLAALMSCNNADKASTETAAPGTDSAASTTASKDSTGGWTNLFDGTGTAGWHTYGTSSVNDRWKVADGAITLDTASKSHGDLVSDKEYGNFDLKLEWKISPKGNSGIIFYTHEDTTKYKETYVTGPEMQVVDNEGHPDGKLVKHQAGDLYDLISSTKKSAKPVGEWNEVEILSKDGKLDLSLNGTVVVSTTLWDDNWKKLIAGSKFKKMPDFGTFKTGHIVLQDHGNMVSYRNIKIKEL